MIEEQERTRSGIWQQTPTKGRTPMDYEEMARRTKALALRIIRVVAALPKTRTGDVLGRRLLRSGTSIGANYREAHRACSRAEFGARIGGVLQETDETCY